MENNQSQFVLKLIELTKEGKLMWKYLDEKEPLYTHLSLIPKGTLLLTLSTTFDKNSSFYVEVNTNYIVLYKATVQENLIDSLRLLTVPSTFKDVLDFSTETNKEVILRLFNVIKSNFPSSESIINDILNM